MTLNEKFSNVQDAYHDRSSECVEIADDFAIGFAEWIAINDYRSYSNGWSKVWEKGTLTSKELLEIYKKEKL